MFTVELSPLSFLFLSHCKHLLEPIIDPGRTARKCSRDCEIVIDRRTLQQKDATKREHETVQLDTLSSRSLCGLDETLRLQQLHSAHPVSTEYQREHEESGKRERED